MAQDRFATADDVLPAVLVLVTVRKTPLVQVMRYIPALAEWSVAAFRALEDYYGKP